MPIIPGTGEMPIFFDKPIMIGPTTSTVATFSMKIERTEAKMQTRR